MSKAEIKAKEKSIEFIKEIQTAVKNGEEEYAVALCEDYVNATRGRAMSSAMSAMFLTIRDFVEDEAEKFTLLHHIVSKRALSGENGVFTQLYSDETVEADCIETLINGFRFMVALERLNNSAKKAMKE